MVLLLGLLVSGSFLFWFRPREPTCRAALVLGATVPLGLTAYPLGLGAIDLAGSRGVWPHVIGEILLTVAIGAMLLAALTFPWTRVWLRAHPLAWVVPFAIPFVSYLVWAAVYAVHLEPDAARLQALITVATPALLVAVPLIIAVEVHGYTRARTREDRIALALVIAGTVWAVLVRVLLGDGPQLQSGRPLVPWEVQALLLLPALLLWLVAAVLRYRLQEVDGVLRRSLLQVVVATLIGASSSPSRPPSISPPTARSGRWSPAGWSHWRWCPRPSDCVGPSASSCTATATSPTGWSPTCAGSTRAPRRPRPCTTCSPCSRDG